MQKITIPKELDQQGLFITGLCLLTWDERYIERLLKRLPYPFQIIMPCGEKFSARSRRDIPPYSIVCPCQDPKHMLFKIAIDPRFDQREFGAFRFFMEN